MADSTLYQCLNTFQNATSNINQSFIPSLPHDVSTTIGSFMDLRFLILTNVASNLYQATKTGFSFGTIGNITMDLVFGNLVFPMVTQAGFEIISDITGFRLNMFYIPTLLTSQLLYAKAKHWLFNSTLNEDQETSLIEYVRKDDIDRVKFCLQTGANLDAKGINGNTALMIAVKKHNIEMVKVLIQAGANLNSQNNGALTPLMHAATSGYSAIVDMLIKAGADLHVVDNYRHTAHALAKLNNNDVSENLLEEAHKNEERFNIQRSMLDIFRALSQDQKNPDDTASFSTLSRDLQTDILTWCYDGESHRSKVKADLQKTENKVQELLFDREDALQQRAAVFLF